MKNLVNIDSIIDNINQKMIVNNLNFNDFEFEIILNNSLLFNKLVDILTKEFNVWKTISNNIFEFFKYNFEGDFSNEFLKNYLFYSIDKGFINGILEINFATVELEQSIKNHLKEKLTNLNYVPVILSLDKELLKLIFELERTELLKNVQYISYIYPESEEKLKTYYSNNELIIPDAIFKSLKNFKCQFRRLNLTTIFNYLEKGEEILNVDDYNSLLDKIKSEGCLKEYNFNWDKIFLNFNDFQKQEVLNALLDNGYYEILGQLSFFTNNNINMYKDKFIKAIMVNKNKETAILNYNSFYLQLLNDENVLLTLINNGKILSASHSIKFSKYIELAIEKVKNNPNIYKNININNFKDLKYYPSMIYILHSIGNNNLNPYIKNNENIKEKIKEDILNGKNTFIPAVLVNEDDFVNKLIRMGKIDLLIERDFLIKRHNFLVFSKENVNFIVEKCIHDVRFAMKFLNSHLSSIINNHDLLTFFLNANNQAREIIINKLNHLEENRVNYTEEMFNQVKDFLIEKYQLNESHFERFAQHFGPLVIRYVDNNNIKQIINLDEEDFNKIIELFPQIDFTMTDVEKIYDSLKQYAFSKIHSEDIEIFARINHSIADNNTNYFKDLDKINEIFNSQVEKERFYKKFNNIYPQLVEKFQTNHKEFLINIINYIQNGTIEEKNYYQNVLHFITDYYIAYKREKYREEYNMTEDLSIPYKLDEKDTRKQFIKHCAVRIHRKLIVMEMQDRGIDETLANDCIDYYGCDKRDFSDKRLVEIKRHLKLLVDISNNILNITGIPESLVESLDLENIIKRKYYAEKNNSSIFGILTELNVETLKNTILSPNNSYLYESLKKYMYKYKLHIIPEYFKDLMTNEYIDINVEIADIASFITYYAQIYEEEIKRMHIQDKNVSDFNLSFTLIMKYAETYSSVSDIYNQILGMEDTRLIKRNPSPNVATRKTAGNARLKEAVSWTINNFKRIEVTVPTVNEVLENNNKSMRVVVGNFTHPSNVTMGERTGSCMRIGGVGDSLFEFVLSDKNGFHIRFENPNTGEFISRVSGFRNGNTVFLNELRCSCNPEDYSNEDVYNFCKDIANLLIIKSKDSNCPIENVVLHNDYATKNLNLKEEYLNIDDNRIGLKNFYCDIKNKAIILASSEIPFTKINFDKSNVPSYLPSRELYFKSQDSKKLRMLINRVHAIKLALDGIKYEYIAPIEFKKDILYGIANQDFYIFIDIDGNIFEEIIDVDARATIELEEARKIIYDIKIDEQIDSKELKSK